MGCRFTDSIVVDKKVHTRCGVWADVDIPLRLWANWGCLEVTHDISEISDQSCGISVRGVLLEELSR